ncbi:MAG: CHAT domain-containing protein [Saprospiraceae bacterium]|nr:CHAT domain-containing protein [Saprospiraceae bacterium]
MNPIQELIAQGRLKEALDALSDSVPSHLKNDVVVLQSKLATLKRNEMLGLLSNSDATLERNKITAGALELVGNGGNGGQHPTPPAASQVTKILFIAANPDNEARLQTDREYRLLKAQLERGSQRDKFDFLQPQLAVTITELVRAMNDKPNIVHFSGHGTEEGIVITTEDNKAQTMPLPALQRLFKPLRTITQIVVLNACYTAAQAKAISELGMYVVGNNLPVTDPAAIGFSEGLYNGFGEGKSFEEAFNDAMTVVLTQSPNEASIVEVWKDGNKLDL